MRVIENDFLRVAIHEKGAELTSIYSKPLNLEYLWGGDPAFWSKHSPVLFPVVGALKNNTYFYQNRPYELPRHGFAREMTFSVREQSSEQITFSLSQSEETLAVYPFHFELQIHYKLNESALNVSYNVTNTGSDEMYFSIGAHPAFRVPLVDGSHYDDYFLEFSKKENSARWQISLDGLIDDQTLPVFSNDSIIHLKKELFSQDALVFKDLVSDRISLKCTKHQRGLHFDFPGFPYMGIWAAKNADFVCIEPWCGIADSVYTDQQLKNKDGINRLEKNETFNRQWKLTMW